MSIDIDRPGAEIPAPADMSDISIAVIITCHNRRELTLSCLYALHIAARGLKYSVFLMDDGSTDGTGDAVRKEFPDVEVLEGDGSLYWNGGMRKAWFEAIESRPDYYLWLNDDLELLPDSLYKLVLVQKEHEQAVGPKVITIGKVVDPSTGKVTYGGARLKSRLGRLSFSRITDDDPRCDTMNGNCVLIPERAVRDIGVLSEHYRHSTGDVDYGLRAVKAGYHLYQAPDLVGETPYNVEFAERQNRLTWSTRRYIFSNPKGVPIGEWLHFCRTHGGWLWPVNFLVRYLKMMRPAR